VRLVHRESEFHVLSRAYMSLDEKGSRDLSTGHDFVRLKNVFTSHEDL